MEKKLEFSLPLILGLPYLGWLHDKQTHTGRKKKLNNNKHCMWREVGKLKDNAPPHQLCNIHTYIETGNAWWSIYTISDFLMQVDVFHNKIHMNQLVLFSRYTYRNNIQYEFQQQYL